MGSLYVCNSWTRWKDLPQGCHDCCPSILLKIQAIQWLGCLTRRERNASKKTVKSSNPWQEQFCSVGASALRCVVTGRSLISERTRAIFSVALLKVFSEGDLTLAAHLQIETVGRVTYLSPQSQNEMIDVIGKHYIQKKLVKEILESKYHAILADEASSPNEEKFCHRHSFPRC